MEFNDAVNKTKEAFAVAKDKTAEIINVGKMKYDIAALERELGKLYTALGMKTYENIGNLQNADSDILDAAERIRLKKEEISAAKAELLKAKAKRLCPKCGSAIDENAVFCSICGEKLIFNEDE